MKILLLTPIYPNEKDKTDTPVVHYFAKEWVKQGHEVVVAHCVANFSKLVYVAAKVFRKFIEKRVGTAIRIEPLLSKEYILDGVRVKRIPLVRWRPHTRYSCKQIKIAVTEIMRNCEQEGFIPDVMAYHWINPQAEIVHCLKKHFNVPVCYVAHDAGYDFTRLYPREYQSFFDDINLIGYRSQAIKNRMIERFPNLDKPCFYCYSGIPNECVEEAVKHDFDGLNTIMYAGLLIKRKYPLEIMQAAQLAYTDKNFSIIYIGAGSEMEGLREMMQQEGLEKQVKLLGRVPREQVFEEMRKNEIFVMISRGETFGLVYLEAMAKGCITIASYGEGFDGIIQNGVNGFLCRAGDASGLADVFRKIKSLGKEEIEKISDNAIKTAQRLTDSNVAREYARELEILVRQGQ